MDRRIDRWRRDDGSKEGRKDERREGPLFQPPDGPTYEFWSSGWPPRPEPEINLQTDTRMEFRISIDPETDFLDRSPDATPDGPPGEGGKEGGKTEGRDPWMDTWMNPQMHP